MWRMELRESGCAPGSAERGRLVGVKDDGLPPSMAAGGRRQSGVSVVCDAGCLENGFIVLARFARA
ncbi:hypothetical protein BDY21DRAFT_351823 [Lineolata rhizophorae]|uniref:Uncharacterized protein n=1 Tax=Lineolata rhizophorae TaxID=578093 RepID=A0A6A6NSZ3_9PEZI|nr:hypothetical protein BDY21DRAFT_351823 [Lineolata rhizophorae]